MTRAAVPACSTLCGALVAALAGCPAASVAGGGLRFACADNDDCLPGQACHAGACTAATGSSDAGQVLLDGAAADRDGSVGDATALDHPLRDGASDGPAAEAALDASGTERPGDDATGADTGASDAIVDAATGTDAGAADAASPDAGATDSAGVADILVDGSAADAEVSDTAVNDTTTDDTAVADTATVDSAVNDLARVDSSVEDAHLPDVSTADTATADSSLPADWWNPAWRERRLISVDSTGVATEQFDVPVLVLLTAARIDYGRVQDGGQDLRFVLLDGTGPLAHEIERWDESGTSVVWVRVPQVPAAADAPLLWMYLDNPAAGDGQQTSAVWSNGYVGVWHMDADPTAGAGAVRDSTTTGAHGTCVNMGSGARVDGRIGRALALDGSDDVIAIVGSATAGHPLDLVGGPMTLSAWIFADAVTGTLLARRRDASVQWQFQIGEQTASGEHSIDFLWANASNAQNLWSTTNTFPRSTWRLVTVIVDASGTPTAFYTGNNTRAFAQTSATSGAPLHRDIDVALGARWAGAATPAFLFNGMLDEVRVDKVARSHAWVVLQHRSMTDALLSYGASERLP